MSDNVVGIWCIEYEMKTSVWKAYIAGFSQEEALQKLSMMLNGPIKKIVGIQYQCRLDAISDNLALQINKPWINKIKTLESKGKANTPSSSSSISEKITSRVKS